MESRGWRPLALPEPQAAALPASWRGAGGQRLPLPQRCFVLSVRAGVLLPEAVCSGAVPGPLTRPGNGLGRLSSDRQGRRLSGRRAWGQQAAVKASARKKRSSAIE